MLSTLISVCFCVVRIYIHFARIKIDSNILINSDFLWPVAISVRGQMKNWFCLFLMKLAKYTEKTQHYDDDEAWHNYIDEAQHMHKQHATFENNICIKLGNVVYLLLFFFFEQLNTIAVASYYILSYDVLYLLCCAVYKKMYL